MEALSALAIVAQRSFLPAGQEAVQKAILKAELERTQLDYERSRMVAEDNRVKCQNHVHIDTWRYAVRVLADKAERIEDLEKLWDEALDENLVLEETVGELKDELQQQCDSAQECYLEHTEPPDTEVNDRRKFMRLFKQ